MGNKTPLYDQHIAMNAKMVDFSGWDMPIHYGSQLNEHHQVRKDCGMFDVSHMNVLDLHGDESEAFLRKLVANDVAKLKTEGKALYTCMLTKHGGVIDDLIIYYMSQGNYRIVLNAATREKDLAWIRLQSEDFVVKMETPPGLAMIAIQGPNARDKVHTVLGAEATTKISGMAPFNATWVNDMFIARTGYTGEDGYEIILPTEQVTGLWQHLNEQGVAPIGLGARDTLRLEAAMNLYGTDMDEEITPLECGLNWTVAWEPADRDFIGRKAIETQRDAGPANKFVGLILEDRGVLRSHQKVVTDNGGEGIITSGTFSPTLGTAIALARVPADTGKYCQVEIRGKLLKARIVRPPFARNGQACFKEID